MNIRHQSELRKHFTDLTESDPDFTWGWAKSSTLGLPLNLCLHLDGREVWFETALELYPGEWKLRDLSKREGKPILLVVPEASDRLVEKCKEKGLSVIDLNGRAWIRAEQVWIQRPPLPARNFHYYLEPRNIFVGKSERIVRGILTDREREWTQAELVERTGASSGLVSRIVKYLVKQAYVTKTGTRTFRVAEGLDLLEDWARTDQLYKRARLKRFAGLPREPWEVARVVHHWAERETVDLVFTQWIAAWERFGYTEPVVCSAYARRFPSQRELETLELREVPEAGQVWIFVPEDEGVFLETQCPQTLPIVTDAQIYVDLQDTGLRGPEAADALRNWEGFCRT